MEGRQLAYRELNERSNQVAHFLRQRRVGPDTPVAICTERSIELVIGQLGILKAGGVYVPLDTTSPQNRITQMLEDTGAAVILTQRHLRDSLPSSNKTEIVCLDEDWPQIATCSIANPSVVITEESPAYIIYTSGSTGRPKGVSIPHRGIVRLVREQDYVPFGPEERHLLLASPSFDAVIFELWGPLLNGGCCVIFPDRLPEFSKLEQVISAQGVSCLWLTASLFNRIIDHRPETLASARHVLIGGEALSTRHVRRARELLPQVALINGYGPTECTTFACTYRIEPESRWQCASVPIGRPINNTECHIVNEAFQPVAINEPGELLLGGAGLALGYHNRPELTVEKFIPNPFNPAPDSRLYRTGDRCRWLPNGLIEYLGRIDDQIKLRGHRIEPGEIEAVLRNLPGVLNSVVLTRDLPHGNQLVACVIPASGATLKPQDLRNQLGLFLPDYMVPAIIRLVDELPLTRNGKVDRRALAARFHVEAPSSPPRSTSPVSSLEDRLLSLWRTVLHNPAIGPADSFFEHGGDSLLSIHLSLEIERALGQRVPISAIYDHPTPAAFARQWNERGSTAADQLHLKGSGPGVPLFHLPGIYGVETLPPSLPPMLAGRRPYYDKLVNPSLLDDTRPLDRVEDLAAAMIRQIRRVRPRGPYCLSGYSFGGIVAYETARQLTAAGERVENVILWDAAPAATLVRKPLPRILRDVTGKFCRDTIPALLRNPFGMIVKLPGITAKKIASILDRFAPKSRLTTLLHPHLPAGSGNLVTSACLRAYHSYVPQPYEGPVLLFHCTKPEDTLGLFMTRDVPGHGWGELIGNMLTIERIHCTHTDFRYEPTTSEIMARTVQALDCSP
jgi:aspartate racemase